MGGQARMRDALPRHQTFGLGRQLGDAPHAAQAGERRIQQCQTRRIVTAVFEFVEALDENGTMPQIGY